MKILELLKPGTYKASTGTHTFTRDDLAQIVTNFKGEVPIVIGHPKDSTVPAWGWIKRVWLDGDVLKGEVEFTPEMEAAFEKGYYRKWSLGLVKGENGLEIEHLAMLGGVQPAVPGLKLVTLARDKEKEYVDVELAAGEKVPGLDTLDFADSDTEWDRAGAEKRVFEKYGWKGLAEYSLLINKEECEKKENGLPTCFGAYKYLVVDIVGGKPVIIPKALSAALAYLHGARGVKVPCKDRDIVEPKLKRLIKKFEETKRQKLDGGTYMDELEKLKKSLKEAEEEKKRLLLEKERLEKERKKLELAQFVEKLEKEGKILPWMKEMRLIDFMSGLNGEQKIQLSKEGTVKAVDRLEWFKEFLSKMPNLVKLGEHVKSEDKKDKSELAAEEREGLEIVKSLGVEVK